MKEQMFSCIDRNDKKPTLVWRRGKIMAVSCDEGDSDPWRFNGSEETDDIQRYCTEDWNKPRFSKMKLIWEREV